MTWTAYLKGDPLPWLLSDDTPGVRAAALRQLCDRPEDDGEVVAARSAAMRTDPVRAILAAQAREGWWEKPGAGYSPKYTATVWQLIFLDQLGADPRHPQIQKACEYVLWHTQTESGGFGASGERTENRPPPSRVIHCLNGNLVRALIGFVGWGDPRVRRAVDWAARAITGDGAGRYYASGTTGPGFACVANGARPCAWGAIKELRAFARIPAAERSPAVSRAIDEGVGMLLSRDPAVADYPMLPGDTRPSASWFKLGFPSGYVADVLQNLEVLCELGHAHDPRLANALEWLAGQQDGDGRWHNRHAYNRKTTVDFEVQGSPSKWVTLRACTVLRAAGWTSVPTREEAHLPRARRS